jgi:hypothetical protein
MMVFNELTEENLFLFAAKNYYKPQFSDIEEFHEDLKRFKYIKRLLNRYLDQGELAERLILNHLIVVCNSFSIPAALSILELKLADKHWPVIKPFLVYLRYIKDDQYVGISMDQYVVNVLRKI